MTILVTGVAGFIGFHTAKALLEQGQAVSGIDCVTDYYDVALKEDRLKQLARFERFSFTRADIADEGVIADVMARDQITQVIHLAAQAGVRYSIDNPMAYERSNLAGQLQMLEACRHQPGFEHLVYASSSSVYGDRPGDGAAFRESDAVEAPVSLYAATKRAGELMGQTYAHLFGIAQTGLRFFTVYGPFGRPDMAYFSFTRKILAGETIEVFGEGEMARDFTYIDDIVGGILAALAHPPGGHRILNIGAGHPEGLMEMITTLEALLGRPAIKSFLPMQPGDVRRTAADISQLRDLTGYQPSTRLKEGLSQFVDWYRAYYKV